MDKAGATAPGVLQSTFRPASFIAFRAVGCLSKERKTVSRLALLWLEIAA
jgi:hypothetical protein